MPKNGLGDKKLNANQSNLMELVEVLESIKPRKDRLNEVSMLNHYYGGGPGDDTEMRTWFCHKKFLEKSGIIRSNEQKQEKPEASEV